MQVNWMSLILVLFDFLKDAGTIFAGVLMASRHPTAGAIVAAAVVSVGKIAVVFGQNQPKPAATPPATPQDTSSKGVQ